MIQTGQAKRAIKGSKTEHYIVIKTKPQN